MLEENYFDDGDMNMGPDPFGDLVEKVTEIVDDFFDKFLKKH